MFEKLFYNLTLFNTATANTLQVSCSPEICYNYNSSSTCYQSFCGLINSEIEVLQTEVKSLTEIVNILNNELKTISQKEANKWPRTSFVPDEGDASLCGNCMKLEMKANEEISSQKVIIDLFMDGKQSKPLPQQHQVNLKTGNSTLIDQDSKSHSAFSIRPKKMCTSSDSSDYDQYSIPTSNRYEVLSTYP